MTEAATVTLGESRGCAAAVPLPMRVQVLDGERGSWSGGSRTRASMTAPGWVAAPRSSKVPAVRLGTWWPKMGVRTTGTLASVGGGAPVSCGSGTAGPPPGVVATSDCRAPVSHAETTRAGTRASRRASLSD